MQEKSKAHLAAALVAALGFVTNATADAANNGHSQVNLNDRLSPFHATSSDSENFPILLAPNGKEGKSKGTEKEKEGSSKGKEGSCKGKEGSCKGKEGSCKGKDKAKDEDRGEVPPGTGTGY